MEIPHPTAGKLGDAIPSSARTRLVAGSFEGEDVVAVRRFVGLDRESFARALGVTAQMLRNWERGRCHPKSRPRALELLRFAARHPHLVRAKAEELARLEEERAAGEEPQKAS